MLDISTFSRSGATNFIFDCAVVNDTSPETSLMNPATSLPTSTSSPNRTGTRRYAWLCCRWCIPEVVFSRNLALIIASALTGLAVIAALLLAFLYNLKRHRSRIPRIHSKRQSRGFFIDPPFPHHPTISRNDPSTSLLPRRVDTPEQATSTWPAVSMTIYPQKTPAHILTPTPPALSTTQTASPSRGPEGAVLSSSDPVVFRTGGSRQGLTALQIVSTVQHLLDQNVPSPVIGTLMESMLLVERPHAGSWETDAPPRYAYMTPNDR